MAEFTIADKQYRSSKLNAFQQFHVARKLGPLFAKLGPGQLRTDPDASLSDMLAPIMEALAGMPEEDCNYILHRCLSVVQRWQGGSVWAPVWNDPAKRLMFEDIDLSTMIQITLQVLGDNLGPFMSGQGRTSASPVSQESSTPENSPPLQMVKTG